MSRNPFRLKQVSVRLRAERPLLAERPVRTPEDAAKLVKDLIADFDREAVCIINLRNDLFPINFSVCSIGTLTASMAEPREMIKAMCLSNATSFLMIHNHPGGFTVPIDTGCGDHGPDGKAREPVAHPAGRSPDRHPGVQPVFQL